MTETAVIDADAIAAARVYRNLLAESDYASMVKDGKASSDLGNKASALRSNWLNRNSGAIDLATVELP